MTEMKPGTRLRSAVCTTEVMVVAAQKDAAVELCCGGRPMLDLGAVPTPAGTPTPAFSSGTQLGKRYVNEAGTLEVLCTKPGAGSLSADGVALKVKGAKPLPSSD
jgi:hypothetical protein